MQQELIATLWLQLTDIYGSRFVNQYGDRDSGVWYQALNDLDEDDLCFCLQAMMRDPRFETWPPNCTQLRHLCLKNSTAGKAPSVHKAFDEAVFNLGFSTPRQWSHPAVKFTVKHVGVMTIIDGRKDHAFAAFSACYERVLERIAAGYQVPEVGEAELIVPRTQDQTPVKLHMLLKQKDTCL
jgi:hypothetical protein